MTLALPRAELTDTSLSMPADASFEEWQEQGARLFTMERAVMWWIGDWWRFGEHRYGEQSSQAAPTGYAVDTLRAAAWVADQIEPVRRRTLSWSHHREVAALPPDEQDYWLQAAEAGEWSRNDLPGRVMERNAPLKIIGDAQEIAAKRAVSGRSAVFLAEAIRDIYNTGLKREKKLGAVKRIKRTFQRSRGGDA